MSEISGRTMIVAGGGISTVVSTGAPKSAVFERHSPSSSGRGPVNVAAIEGNFGDLVIDRVADHDGIGVLRIAPDDGKEQLMRGQGDGIARDHGLEYRDIGDTVAQVDGLGAHRAEDKPAMGKARLREIEAGGPPPSRRAYPRHVRYRRVGLLRLLPAMPNTR